MNRKTVLIVDDSDSICDALASVLELKGYEVVSVHDGEQGVQGAHRHHPDVILLDIMMPVLDGWGTIRKLKEARETADIPVLALTALRLAERQVREAGFAGYLGKPVRPHLLIEEIERACACGVA